MALIPPFFSDCVVAIGSEDGQRNRHWIASGFLYGHHLADTEGGGKQYRVALVTNRHVLDGLEKAWLRFNPRGGEQAREFQVLLTDAADGSAKWFTHSNADIDIAVLTINVLYLQTHNIQFSFFRSDGDIRNYICTTTNR